MKPARYLSAFIVFATLLASGNLGITPAQSAASSVSGGTEFQTLALETSWPERGTHVSLIPALLCLLLLSRVIAELFEHYGQPAMIGQGIFTILVLMAVVTTFVTPLLLQHSFRRVPAPAS